MPKLTIVATIRARPGHEEAVLEGLRGLVAPTRAEEGCAHYDLHRDLEDPRRFVFHETWESEAHLARHLQSPHIVAHRARVGSLIEEIALQRLERVE
jgi:quinol monooxygenase YgiN